jgi:hypothetical protein
MNSAQLSIFPSNDFRRKVNYKLINSMMSQVKEIYRVASIMITDDHIIDVF